MSCRHDEAINVVDGSKPVVVQCASCGRLGLMRNVNNNGVDWSVRMVRDSRSIRLDTFDPEDDAVHAAGIAISLLPAGAESRAPDLARLIRGSVQTLMNSVAAMRAQGYEFSSPTHAQLDTAASVVVELQHGGTVWIMGPEPVPRYQGILTTKGKVSGG